MEKNESPQKLYPLRPGSEPKKHPFEIGRPHATPSGKREESGFPQRRPSRPTSDEQAYNRRLARNLEEARTALKLLLHRHQRERKELDESISENLHALIIPYLRKLCAMNLNERQREMIHVIENNLQKITSPFIRNLSIAPIGLTPREIEVADLIRHGRTSKEIADALGMSKTTIDKHRYHIRKKCGIQNKKVSLRAKLMALRK